jgi:hypothetical protein
VQVKEPAFPPAAGSLFLSLQGAGVQLSNDVTNIIHMSLPKQATSKPQIDAV